MIFCVQKKREKINLVIVGTVTIIPVPGRLRQKDHQEFKKKNPISKKKIVTKMFNLNLMIREQENTECDILYKTNFWNLKEGRKVGMQSQRGLL